MSGYLKSRDGVVGPWSPMIDALFERFDRPGSPGLNLAVTKDGTVAHRRGYGVASLEDDTPFTLGTRLNLGSTSKHMCATALLILENRGLLSLEDPVRRHLPELPEWAEAMSLRRLLNMTSGLPDGLNWPLFCGLEPGALSEAAHLELLTRLPAPMVAPGAAVHYSNSNYLLLSRVVKLRSGRSLASFLRDELFAPLGMASTDLVSDQSRVLADRARGYQPSPDGGFSAAPPMTHLCGDGGVITTVEDMLKWLDNYADDQVFGLNYRARLETEGLLADGAPTGYGLGLTVSDTAGRRKVGHVGGMPGYLSDFAWFPDQRLGVILLTNVMDEVVLEATDRIADIIDPRPARAATACPAGPDLSGVWVNLTVGCTLEFERAGDGLFLRIMGERLAMDSSDGLHFRAAKPGSPYRLRVIDPHALEVEVGAAGPLTFVRFEDPGTISFEDYLGAYHSALLGETHLVSRKGAGLRVGLAPGVRTLLWGDLKPRGGDVFSAVIPGESDDTDVTLKFRRDAAGRVSGFDYNLSRMRGVSFDRRPALHAA